MAKKIGVLCIVLGFLCLLAAVGLIGYNRWEEQQAALAATAMLANVQEQIAAPPSEEPAPPEPLVPVEEEPEPIETVPEEMPITQVNGYDCIGVLSIPVLELELPVLTDWSYEKLKVAPCLYYGTYYRPDFVIAAHNYQSHFARLSELQAGDLILFTDVENTARYYEVVLLETLPANATEAMVTSGFDLSLYTCTPGGSNRVTVRCSALRNG